MTKEAILSGGAIQTPQTLQLSGIGERAVLDKLGVETVVDLPGVGANLQDHAGAPIVGSRKLSRLRQWGEYGLT